MTENHPTASLIDGLKAQLDSADSYKIVAEVRAAGALPRQLEVSGQLCRHLYRERKDVSRMLLVGRLSLQQALTQLELAKGLDESAREQTLGAVKALSYNLSADAWPGWQEPGIDVSLSDSLAALDLARLNLRLATELKRETVVHGDAHWLIGAHRLALGEDAEARRSFQVAADHYLEGGSEERRLMAAGYSALSLLRTAPERGRAHLNAVNTALAELGTDDATFFRQQLSSVRKWLENRQGRADGKAG